MTDEILKEAIEQFNESESESKENRENYHEDILFGRMGEQWDDNIKDIRQKESRPCLTINKMPSFVRQVINEARQNKPGMLVSPIDNGADEDTAEVIGGLIRAIERNSNADVAYDTAIDNSASGGFGFFRVGIDFAHENTFAMEAKIDRIPNPLAVHWDVNSIEFDASDWNYAFVSDMLSQDEFEADYPDASKVSFEGDTRDGISHWRIDDRIRVAEYWVKEQEDKNLLLLSNGRIVREDLFPATIRNELGGAVDVEGVEDKDLIQLFMATLNLEELRRRTVKVPKVTRRIINGNEVLEEDPWPGTMIPICPVWGEEIFVEGKRQFRSMIRDARDPQTMFNYWRSATTELVALAPKAPWVIEEGAIPPGEMHKWATANTRSHAYLAHAKGSQQPTRQAFAGVPAGALQESLNANDDMKSVIGIFDASLGARGNETSGRAILARQRESDVSNFHFTDNLSRAIQYAGRILVEIIPHVYTEQETIRILGEDSRETVAALKQSGVVEDGKLYDLTVGKYDVTVKAGPSFASQREETRETLIEIMRQIPGAAEFLGPEVLEVMDFQGADKMAERLRQLLQPIPVQAGQQAPPGGAVIPIDGANNVR